MTDVLLLNGLTPLRRSPSDVFLDNGIGMLRQALVNSGLSFEIEDPITLDFMDTFNNIEISKPLRVLFEQKLFGKSGNWTLEQEEKTKALYSELISFHKVIMNEYQDSLCEKIARNKIPLVGIKLWSGSTFDYCVSLYHKIRQTSPETVVVAGGPQVNCFKYDGMILKLSPFDVAVYSEGEQALIELAQICRIKKDRSSRLQGIAQAKVLNTIVRKADEIIINPARTLAVNSKLIPDYGDFSGKVPVHTIIDALGCDYGKCNFCIHPKIYPGFKKREPVLVVDEICEMLKRGIGMFTFTASDTPVSHAVKMSLELEKRGLNIEYTMLTRAIRNAGKKQAKIIEQFRILIRQGLKTVFIGAESGNDQVLANVMNKGIKACDICDSVLAIREASLLEDKYVNIITSFIFPVPLTQQMGQKGLTQEKVMEDNLKLLEKMRPDSFHCAPGLVYPGTNWYLEAEKFNIQFKSPEFEKKWIRQELSYHGYFETRDDFIYSFNNVPLQKMLEKSMEFARAGNAMGIPTDLWEEHFTLACASGINTQEGLQELSRDLFLDLLTCNDSKTRKYYDRVCQKSAQIASVNPVAGC